MPYVLGIDIGAGATKAAVCRRADGPGPCGTATVTSHVEPPMR